MKNFLQVILYSPVLLLAGFLVVIGEGMYAISDLFCDEKSDYYDREG